MPYRFGLTALATMLLLAACRPPAQPPQVPPEPAPQTNPTTQPGPAPGSIVATVEGAVPPRPEQPWVRSAAFATAERGWLLFGDAPALATADGGQTWQPAELPHPFSDMAFFTPRFGLARTQDATFRTTDGGVTWAPVDASDWPAPMPQFVDERHGWAMQKDELHATADGGETWYQAASPCPPGSRRPFSFVTPRTGWILCGFQGGAGFMSKRLFRTDDGGKSWTMLGEALAGPGGRPEEGKPWPGGLPFGDYVGDLFFLDGQHGWFTGARYSSFFATQDGGRTWNKVSAPGQQGSRVRFLDARVGYRYGIQQGVHTVVMTRDSGATWTQIYPPVRPREVFYLDAQTYVGVLDSALYRSSDAGHTWAPLGRLSEGEHLVNMQYASRQEAWALTAVDKHRRLYASRDGGVTWTLVSDSPELDYAQHLSVVDGRTAVLWDGADRLFMTRNGGASLARRQAPEGQYGGHGLQFRTAEAGWLTRNALLYRTGDGAQSWQTVPMEEHQKVQGVALTPDGRVWALAVDTGNPYTPVAMLLASADGGKTWTRYTLGTFDQPNSVSRCGLQSICVPSGGGGPGIVSHDEGRTWTYRN